MAHLYLNETLTAISVGDRVSIEGEEARHAVTVSRVRTGEVLAIGNGKGLVATGPVLEATAKNLSIDVTGVAASPRRMPLIRLVQALAKGGRDELAIQAATELGVDGVIPWAARRSVVKWSGDRLARGEQRWSAIVREASKQSLRSWLPEVGALLSLARLAELATAARMLVLEPTASIPLAQAVSRLASRDHRDIVLVVGPEGGVAPDELATLAAGGAAVVRLGDAVLRTSTAGPAALAVLNTALGRW